MTASGGVALMPHVAPLASAVPHPLVGDFLSKLHYVSEELAGFEIDMEGRAHVRFRLREGATQDPAVIAARIAETAQKMSRSYRAGGEKVLASRLDRDVPFADDPHPVLEATDELTRYGAGRFGLGPRLSALTTFFDRRIADLARDFPARTYQFPSLIGADTLDRCRYIKSFPHSLNFVAHLREDLGAIQHFAQNVKWTGDHLACSHEDLAGIKTLLSPSVCFHYYAWLHDRQLAEPTSITAIGKCFRYESGNLGGLERLWDFSMREVIFVGPREHVLAERQRALELTMTLLDEWGLRYEIKSATDPFFIDDFATQATFQMAFDLKFEIRAALPYKQGSLAAGSFNYHQDFFGRSFNITDSSGGPVHTGCIGFGLERLALAFLAQYGFDSRRWPASVSREVGW
jgi:hypothetical protein